MIVLVSLGLAHARERGALGNKLSRLEKPPGEVNRRRRRVWIPGPKMRFGTRSNTPILLRTGNAPIFCFERVTAIPVFERVANRKPVTPAAAGRRDWWSVIRDQGLKAGRPGGIALVTTSATGAKERMAMGLRLERAKNAREGRPAVEGEGFDILHIINHSNHASTLPRQKSNLESRGLLREGRKMQIAL